MILVTGGAGYIGSHTLLELEFSGLKYVVLDDVVNGHREAVRGAPLVVGDLSDRALLEQTLKKHSVDTVIHFAARACVGESVEQPAKYVRDNSVGMFHLLEAMRATGVRRFIFSSTCAVYGVPESVPILESESRKPISPYGFTKRFCEEMLEAYCNAYQFAVVALRYFNAAGSDPEGRLGEWHEPETHLIPRILRSVLGGLDETFAVFGTDYPTRDGTCIRDYIHVSDLARAHRLALDHLRPGSFQAFNLGTGRGTSVLEVLAAAEKVTGRKVKYEVHGRRAGDPPELVAGASLAGRALGFEARYPDIDSIVAHAFKWLKTHPRGYST